MSVLERKRDCTGKTKVIFQKDYIGYVPITAGRHQSVDHYNDGRSNGIRREGSII